MCFHLCETKKTTSTPKSKADSPREETLLPAQRGCCMKGCIKDHFCKNHFYLTVFHKHSAFHVIGQWPNVGRWFALWLMASETPCCRQPKKDTACQTAVERAMLKGKEDLPLGINSVLLKMLKKDDACLRQTDPAFSLAWSEAYRHV